jgi:pyridoxamine-phosphate oxidase
MTAGGTLTGDTSLHLPEFDAPPADPLPLLREWFDGAVTRGVREPLAVSLATADAAGALSIRTVLVKEFDGERLVFTSFRGSRKGKDLTERPWAAVNFYWRETLQQISVTGRVEVVDDHVADALFAERPRAAQATTAVSRQSRPLRDELGLRGASRRLAEGADLIARPTEWTGYRLAPTSIEFWHGSTDRLHRRLRYDRVDDRWTVARLYP